MWGMILKVYLFIKLPSAYRPQPEKTRAQYHHGGRLGYTIEQYIEQYRGRMGGRREHGAKNNRQ
jgi:hypothetical protein